MVAAKRLLEQFCEVDPFRQDQANRDDERDAHGEFAFPVRNEAGE